MSRIDKDNYYLNIAETVLGRGTCLRRNFGAVIVKDDVIVSTGYTGSPRGRNNCCDWGVCEREKQKVAPGERYELCKSVHAEANAIISAPRERMLNATLYLVGHNADGTLNENATPCAMCRRLIINSGISDVIIRRTPTDFDRVFVRDWVFTEI